MMMTVFAAAALFLFSLLFRVEEDIFTLIVIPGGGQKVLIFPSLVTLFNAIAL